MTICQPIIDESTGSTNYRADSSPHRAPRQRSDGRSGTGASRYDRQ